jgi:hypothetical protein
LSDDGFIKFILTNLLLWSERLLPLQPCSEGTGEKLDVFRVLSSKNVRVPKMFGSKFFEVM